MVWRTDAPILKGHLKRSCGPGSPWSSISYNSEGNWLHMWPKISKWCRMLKRSQILDTVMLKISSVIWVSTLSLKPVLVLFFKICNLKHPDSGMIFNKGHLERTSNKLNRSKNCWGRKIQAIIQDEIWMKEWYARGVHPFHVLPLARFSVTSFCSWAHLEGFSLELQRSFPGKLYKKINWNCPVLGKRTKEIIERQDSVVFGSTGARVRCLSSNPGSIVYHS